MSCNGVLYVAFSGWSDSTSKPTLAMALRIWPKTLSSHCSVSRHWSMHAAPPREKRLLKRLHFNVFKGTSFPDASTPPLIVTSCSVEGNCSTASIGAPKQNHLPAELPSSLRMGLNLTPKNNHLPCPQPAARCARSSSLLYAPSPSLESPSLPMRGSRTRFFQEMVSCIIT